MPDKNPNVIAPGLPEKPDERRRLEVQWGELEKLAETAAGLTKNREIQERLKDPDMRAMILGLVERQADGSLRFLPEKARILLQQWHPAFVTLPEELEKAKGHVTDELNIFLQNFEDSVAEVNDAQKQPNVVAADFPLLAEVRAILERLPKDREASQKKLFVLVDAMQKTLAAPRAGTVAEFVASLPEEVRKDADVLKLLSALPQGGAFTDVIAEQLIAGIVKLHPVHLTPQDRTDLGKAVVATDKSLEQIDKQKRELIATSKFKSRGEYLRYLTGSTVDRVLAMSMSGDELDFEELRITLIRIGIDPATLNARRLQVVAGAREMKVKLTDEQREKLSAFLRNDLQVENRSVLSINELLIRALIPEDVARQLTAAYANAEPKEDANGVTAKPNISVLTLGRLAEIDGLSDGLRNKKIAERLLDLVTEKSGDQFVIDENGFIELFTFLFLQGDPNVNEARAEAQILLDALEAQKLIAHQGDQRHLVKRDDVIKVIQAQEIGASAKTYLEEMRKAEIQDITLWGKAKMVGSESRATSGKLFEKWIDDVKNCDDLVWYPDLDRELRPLNQKEKALKQYRDAVKDIAKGAEKPSTVLEAVLENLRNDEKKRSDLMKPLPPAATPKEQAEAMKELLLTTDHVMRELNRLTGNVMNTLPVRDQKIAVAIALHVGMPKALDYVNRPSLDILTPAERLAIDKYLVNQEVIEASGNILSDMREKLDVTVYGGALPLLAYTLHPKEYVPLAMSAARIDNWFVDPASAGPALDAILIGPESHRQAIIMAFTANAEVAYIDEKTGQQRTITSVEARKYVLAIKEHLGRQTADYDAAKMSAEQKNRFTNPLDLLKSGGKELIKMINSNSTAEKLLGYAIVISAGVILFTQWRKGGIGKKLILGIPLFLGADVLLNRLTGQGILERFGMNYMDPKQRSGVLEQFIREKQGDKYAFMKTDAGEEAVDKLTSHSEPIPVSDLIAWRRARGVSGRGNAYGMTAPQSLRGAAEAVVAKMPGLDKQGRSYEGQLEMAYEYLYLTFDALCGEVAVLNGLGEPAEERGANLIEARYVKFNEPFMTPDLAEAMKKGAPHPCGFTMLDVLVFERKTPAMSEDLLQNDMFLEWVLKGTGIAIEEAKQLLKQGYSLAQIYSGEAKRLAVRTFETGKGVAIDSWEAFVDWYSLTYDKTKAEVVDSMGQTLRSVFETLWGAGLYIVYDGPKLAVKAVEGGGTIALNVAQGVYLEVETHMGTGNVLFALEEFFRDRFGWDMGTLLLEEEVKKQAEKLSELASRQNWRDSIRGSLNSIIRGRNNEALEDVPNQLNRLDRYLIAAYKDLTGLDLSGTDAEKLAAFDQLDPSLRMAVYELVKRRLYSKLTAAYMQAIRDRDQSGKDFGFPLRVIGWPPDQLLTTGLEHQIDETYGVQTPLLLAQQKTIPGRLQRSILSLEEGTIRTILEAMYWPMDIAAREQAMDYLMNNAIVTLRTYRKDAERLLRDDPRKKEKLEYYDQYLETVLTNIIMELTFPIVGQPEAQLHGDLNTRPLELTVERARDFLKHLQESRSASPDPQKLGESLDGNFDALKVFEKKSDLPDDLLQYYKDAAERTTAPDVVPPTPAELTSVSDTEKQKIEQAAVAAKELIDQGKPLTTPQLETIISGLGRKGVDTATRDTIRARFNEAAPLFLAQSGLDFSDENTLKELSLYIRGVEDQATRKKLRDELAKHFEAKGTIKELDLLGDIREKEARPELHLCLQEALDIGAVAELKEVVERMKKIPKGELVRGGPKATDFAQIENDLLKLYDATSIAPDRTTDLVSRALEWLWYRGENPGYEQFVQELSDRSGVNGIRKLAPIPPEVASYEYDGSGQRSSAPKRLERSFNNADQDTYLYYILKDAERLQRGLSAKP